MAAPELLLVNFLLNALYQSSLLAALGAGLAVLLRNAPAAARHRLWVATLVLAVVAPFGSLVSPSAGRTPSPRPPAAARRNAVVLSDADFGAGAKHLGVLGLDSARQAGSIVAGLYLLFVLAQGVRLFAGWRRTTTLLARAAQPSTSMDRAAQECGAGLGRRVRVRVSGEATVPMTFGIRAPVVVIPSSLVADGADLRGILVHEIAHVVRRDCALNLLCEVIALPLWFHPAIRFVKRRIGGAREAACDEAAASLVGSRVYARTLLDVAARACRPSLAGALGVLDGGSLEERMKRILEERTGMSRRAATSVLVGGVCALALAARHLSEGAVVLAAEAGPDDMRGRWAGTLGGGPRSGQPAADLTVRLTPSGPDVTLTLYRYDRGADLKAPATKEILPAIQHGVEKGVLRFRTRAESFRIRPDDAPAPAEMDWQFAVVGKDAGELTLLRNSRIEADKAKGIDVPPPPAPLAMTRTARE